MAYQGFQQYFPHPSKSVFSRCFASALTSCTAMSAQPISAEQQPKLLLHAATRCSFFLPLHVYLAAWHLAEQISHRFLKMILHKGEIWGGKNTFWFYSYVECSDLEFIFDITELCLVFTLNINFNMNFNDSHGSLYLKSMSIESFQNLLVFRYFKCFIYFEYYLNLIVISSGLCWQLSES